MSEEKIDYEYELNEEIDVATLESWKVDRYIELVKSNQQEIEKYKQILEQRKMELDRIFKEKEDRLNKQNHFLLTTLNTYAKQQKDLKSTKTQFKLSSLSGDIIIKKSQAKITKPKKEVIDKIEELYPEYIETVEEKKLNWKDLKPQLVVQNGKVFNKETGEDITHLVPVEISQEETIIK